MKLGRTSDCMNSWIEIIPSILRKPPHVDMSIPNYLVPEPTQEGFKETLGDLQGQTKDYELTLQDGKRIHVRKFDKTYRVHWDWFSPVIDPINHMRYDAPHWWIALCTLGGAGLGGLCCKDRATGAIAGGLLGVLVGILSLPTTSK
jgi:hypothetical protein